MSKYTWAASLSYVLSPVSRPPTISFAVKAFHYCFSVSVAASIPHHPPTVLGQNSLEKRTRCFSVIFPLTMQNIKLPQTSEHAIKQSNGYWLTTWYQSLKTSREGSNSSSASEKMLNYVCKVLAKIVGGLNNNFSKLSDDLKEIIHHHKIEGDLLLSKIEATNRKVDRLQETLKHNEQKMDKIIQQLSAWTTSSSIQFEQKTLTIKAPSKHHKQIA